MLAPTSVWNQRLPANAPIDSNSATYVEKIIAQREEFGAGLSFREYGLGVWWTNESTARQKVWVDKNDEFSPKLRAAFESVPIPPNARAPGPFPGDQIMCVFCLRADGKIEYFEFHRMLQIGVDAPRTAEEVPGCTTLNEAGWHCDAGAAVKDLRTNPGWFREEDWPGGQDSGAKWGCSASLNLLYSQVITVSEAQRLYIPHALRMDLKSHRETFRWPALASDGKSSDPNEPENGTIFTFASTDTFPDVTDPFLHAVCVAIRDYGWILTDGTGDGITVAKGECQATKRESETFGTDAWKGTENKFGSPGAILSETASTLAKKIPLSRLRVIDASYRPSSTAPGGLGVGK